MTSPDPSPSLADRQFAVLLSTFPGWHIARRPNGAWAARRTTPPTPEQAQAGVHQYLIQPSMQALAAVLTQQLGILQGFRPVATR